jgi:hypothetical protein
MSAKPVSASGTLWIDALHGPAGQILHARVLLWPLTLVRASLAAKINDGGDFAPERLWCQEEMATRCSGRVAVWKIGT